MPRKRVREMDEEQRKAVMARLRPGRGARGRGTPQVGALVTDKGRAHLVKEREVQGRRVAKGRTIAKIVPPRKEVKWERPASYVKAGIIKDGKFNVREVHGSDLMLDSTIEWDYDAKKPIQMPNFKSGEAYVKWCQENDFICSGTKEERFAMGNAQLKTQRQEDKFFDWLTEEDNREWSDENPGGYKYNSIIDLDNNLFISMEKNWYANYERYLPKGWKYIELEADVMNHLYFDTTRERVLPKLLKGEKVTKENMERILGY